jgi:Bifunctional DNA primase/polymerase, N-terminal
MTLPLAFSGIPTIPVQVWQEEGRWRKLPLAEWDQATTDEDRIERWWRKWPQARPGVPLAAVGWCAIDVDDPADEAWVAQQPLRMLGPHSRINTPSGGLHLVFAQPDPPISKFQWSPGVEILGTSCLLTIHDVEEILFPKVAPRAILPKIFWKPLARDYVCPIKKREAVAEAVVRDVAEVADATAALWEMDPRDWGKVAVGPRGRLIGDYHGWFALMCGAKFVGISCREWVRWSCSDPFYAADARKIERMWEACEPRHGGAFYAACAARGIRLRKGSRVFNGVHTIARTPAGTSEGTSPSPDTSQTPAHQYPLTYCWPPAVALTECRRGWIIQRGLSVL